MARFGSPSHARATQVLGRGTWHEDCTVGPTARPALNETLNQKWLILYFQSSYMPDWIDHFNGTVSSIQAASQLNLTITLTDRPPAPRSGPPLNRPNVWTHGIHRLFSHHVHMALMMKLDPCHRWAHLVQKSLPDLWSPSLSFKKNKTSYGSVGPVAKERLGPKLQGQHIPTPEIS